MLYTCSFFAQLTDKFAIRSNEEKTEVQECVYQKHLPDFLWLVRDHNLEDKKLTLTEFTIKHILSSQSSVRDSTTSAVSKTLLTLYNNFKCMGIPHPGKTPTKVASVNKLAHEFNKAIDDSKKYILSVIKPRTGVDSEVQVDGALLAELARNYVEA